MVDGCTNQGTIRFCTSENISHEIKKIIWVFVVFREKLISLKMDNKLCILIIQIRNL